MTSESKTDIYLSIVVPAYNEEKRLGTTLDRLTAYMGAQGYSYEILVVDDGSVDGTVDLIRERARRRGDIRLVKNAVNRGKGYSVRHGIEEARGEYSLFSDADLSTPIEDVEKLFPKLKKGFDVAIGSRALKESDVRVHQPWYRELMGKTFNKIVRLIVLHGIKDTQCGFKLFKTSVAKEVFSRQRIERFSFDVEALFIAQKRGYRIAEVPVTWYNSPSSTVSVMSDPIRMFTDVVRIRYYALKGYYR
jgi:dolichyl-phosphate beta-glucosyltransferase